MSIIVPIVGFVLAVWLISLGMTRRYTFCEKCGQKQWHRIKFGSSKDMHRNIWYDTVTCRCMTCDQMKWSEETKSTTQPRLPRY